MEFTVRNAAKYAVTVAIHSKVSSVTQDAITDYTQFEEDDKIVHFGGHMVGWFVSDKLKPHTNKMVDKTADFIVAKRAARAAKKNTAEEQK